MSNGFKDRTRHRIKEAIKMYENLNKPNELIGKSEFYKGHLQGELWAFRYIYSTLFELEED